MASGGGSGLSKLDRGTMVATALAAGVAALAAWAISKWFGSESEDEHRRKMMKAPGQDYYMPREDFKESPRTYLRNLRGKD